MCCFLQQQYLLYCLVTSSSGQTLYSITKGTTAVWCWYCPGVWRFLFCLLLLLVDLVLLTCVGNRDVVDWPSINIKKVDTSSINTIANTSSSPLYIIHTYFPSIYCPRVLPSLHHLHALPLSSCSHMFMLMKGCCLLIRDPISRLLLSVCIDESSCCSCSCRSLCFVCCKCCWLLGSSMPLGSGHMMVAAVVSGSWGKGPHGANDVDTGCVDIVDVNKGLLRRETNKQKRVKL